MKKLLLLAASVGTYYLFKNKQAKKQPKQPIVKSTNTLQTKNDEFNLSGEYIWTFYLGPIKQTSIHVFAKDYIDYRMRGKAHSTDYRMHKLSYDHTQQKWIGKADDEVVYVLFFKQHQADKNQGEQITIYKHKCDSKGDEGIKEALDFAYPEPDATADHGWNIYSKKGTNEPQDILPFSGNFVSKPEQDTTEDRQNIAISDSQITLSDKTYQKLTHHLSERRWVGQCDDEYLVMFYENANDATNEKNAQLSLKHYQDIEKAYKSKHDAQTYMNFERVDNSD
ncbi:MAG: hypothetical protein CSA42_01630 [Gammaproteobacteria bacterium]|nr:MAG: hypothetical protein CSA42_01630 [Gammaproteobacteria bacterium]